MATAASVTRPTTTCPRVWFDPMHPNRRWMERQPGADGSMAAPAHTRPAGIPPTHGGNPARRPSTRRVRG